MKLKVYNGNIYHFLCNNQKEMTLAFFRMQEFYESPNENLRGKIFSCATFLNEQTEKNGKIEYFHKWRGFNIPGNVVCDFFREFPEISSREQEIRALLKDVLDYSANSGKCYTGKIKYDSNFYVIASLKGDKDTFNHEICHALYFLDKNFREKIGAIPDKKMREKLGKKLVKYGYPDDKKILLDEICAYLATDKKSELVEIFKEVPDRKLFKHIFKERLNGLQ